MNFARFVVYPPKTQGLLTEADSLPFPTADGTDGRRSVAPPKGSVFLKLTALGAPLIPKKLPPNPLGAPAPQFRDCPLSKTPLTLELTLVIGPDGGSEAKRH